MCDKKTKTILNKHNYIVSRDCIISHIDIFICLIVYIFTNSFIHSFFFSALHGMPARTSDEKGVCLFVRLSVYLSNAYIVTKRKKDTYVRIFIPYERF